MNWRVVFMYVDAVGLAVGAVLDELYALARDTVMAALAITMLVVSALVLFVPHEAVSKAFDPTSQRVVAPSVARPLVDDGVGAFDEPSPVRSAPPVTTLAGFVGWVWDAARALLMLAWVAGFLVACYRRSCAWTSGERDPFMVVRARLSAVRAR